MKLQGAYVQVPESTCMSTEQRVFHERHHCLGGPCAVECPDGYCLDIPSEEYRQKKRSERQRRNERIKANTRPGERLTDAQKQQLLVDFGYHCAYCGQLLDESNPPTFDHIVPIARGGRDTITNVVPACQLCNSTKKDSLIAEWVHRHES